MSTVSRLNTFQINKNLKGSIEIKSRWGLEEKRRSLVDFLSFFQRMADFRTSFRSPNEIWCPGGRFTMLLEQTRSVEIALGYTSLIFLHSFLHHDLKRTSKVLGHEERVAKKHGRKETKKFEKKIWKKNLKKISSDEDCVTNRKNPSKPIKTHQKVTEKCSSFSYSTSLG